MCPADDSHLTVEFDDHFIISPSITFYSRKSNFTENLLHEKGITVKQGFEYNSGSNINFLDINTIKSYNQMS